MGAEIASSVKSEQPIEYDIHFFRDWLLTLSFVTIIPMLRRFFPTYACNRGRSILIKPLVFLFAL
jgi:hypothetical protein